MSECAFRGHNRRDAVRVGRCRLLSAARQAKDGNFGYVDTVVSTAELSGYMRE